MKPLRVILIVPALCILMACSTSLEDYQGTTPAFDLKAYFADDVTAWGIVQDYSGALTRRFCVDIKATWQGNQGRLHETFYYQDGEQQVRIWTLQIEDDGNVTGTAGDVVGVASGGAMGTAFNWRYTLTVPVDDTTYDLAVDDWMYMLDNTRMMNRSYLSKFGVTVAEVSIFFDKTPPLRQCSPSTAGL